MVPQEAESRLAATSAALRTATARVEELMGEVAAAVGCAEDLEGQLTLARADAQVRACTCECRCGCGLWVCGRGRGGGETGTQNGDGSARGRMSAVSGVHAERGLGGFASCQSRRQADWEEEESRDPCVQMASSGACKLPQPPLRLALPWGNPAVASGYGTMHSLHTLSSNAKGVHMPHAMAVAIYT